VLKRLGMLMLLASLVTALLSACDQKKIEELEEGVATEADVRAKFGEPVAVYAEENGARTLEYPRQPEGQRNYMITVGSDGKMSALRQVLKPETFAKVKPGLDKAQVRRLLGRPAKTQVYPLKQEEVWDWRFLDGAESKVFSATFDRNGIVAASAAAVDPRENNVGGK
jgi:outer membrane protein assembly factor BamE (lipoprotein component of BamABCDE complex)